MALEMVLCPHCHTRVAPHVDGTCPACRQNTRHQPASESEREHDAVRDGFQDASGSTAAARSIAFLSEFERPFRALRTDLLVRAESRENPDIATADRIRQELLPQYVAAVDQLHQFSTTGNDSDTCQLIESVTLRGESWRVLAEALSENDPVKLKQHQELWRHSELSAPGLTGRHESPATRTQAGRGYSFQQALEQFTPRLITTPAIVAVNILVFATMIATGVHFFEPAVQSILDWGANYGPATENGQWWRLVTCIFLHYGIVHLGFNMWVLWDLGRVVERLVGNVGFAVLYFISGIAGSIASLTWNPVVVSAGASGAVFGVAGALLGLIALRRDTIPAEVLKHLWKSMSAFLVCNMVIGMMVPGIDMAAHIGGLIAGFVCGLILSQPLSVDRIVRRRFRNATASVAGAITLLLWTCALSHIPRATPPPLPLPACTSEEVANLLDQVVRSTPVGATLKSIDGHREVSYDSDADIRHGECVAHTDTKDLSVKFIVEWQDRDQGLFRVQIPPVELPLCTHPEVTQLLDQALRGTPVGATLKSIDGHRELSYDSDAEIRHGECVAHTDVGDIPVRFVIEWQDRRKGQYQVRTLPSAPP